MRKSVEPEYCVANEVVEDQTRHATKREHAISASHGVLDCAYGALNARDMFTSGSGVENRKIGAQGFEFRVGQDADNVETAIVIHADCSLQAIHNCRNLTICETFHGDEMQRLRMCDKESHLINELDVDFKGNVTVGV